MDCWEAEYPIGLDVAYIPALHQNERNDTLLDDNEEDKDEEEGGGGGVGKLEQEKQGKEKQEGKEDEVDKMKKSKTSRPGTQSSTDKSSTDNSLGSRVLKYKWLKIEGGSPLTEAHLENGKAFLE